MYSVLLLIRDSDILAGPVDENVPPAPGPAVPSGGLHGPGAAQLPVFTAPPSTHVHLARDNFVPIAPSAPEPGFTQEQAFSESGER